ncbi:uncharacterized protein E5676_scaffold388G00830 [Cucumis melo var. makuwa]|uniref:Uncharacterized protein n=1 Tax=Cucumis melo var. makuwa TaxID=1194695 RepID=A0A5D3BR84_CUCMM|nr:uncharacterized protein E5676_scaffold388G00830 [Cucumis melo var. makuwa]
MELRRYLLDNHVWRRNKLHDGSVERRPPPIVLNGHDILGQVDFLEFQVMSTLLNFEGKTKDTMNARLVLQDLKIRKDLHLIEVGNRLVKSHTSYMLTSNEGVAFCNFLKSVKFLDGVVSNISRCVNEGDEKVSSLKTHDYHILLHQLLSIVGEFEVFMHKVRPLGATSSKSLSQEEKRQTHWCILSNVDEIVEYCKQAALSTYSKDINEHFLISLKIRSSKRVKEIIFRMISSHLRWDLHLTFNPTLDASWVGYDFTDRT